MTSGKPDLGIHGKNASTASQSGTTKRLDKPSHLIYRKNASTGHVEHVPTKHGIEREQKLVYRFAMQAAARELLPREAVSTCMRGVVPMPDGQAVSVLYAPVSQAAHYGGLQCCKSVWHCPVCAAKISERRREELTEATKQWPGPMLLVTYTLQHDATEPLFEVLAALKKARRLLMSGRAAKAFNEQYGIAGMVRALELTHGENGWHPHLHCLLFLDNQIDLLGFEMGMKQRWSQAVALTGKYASWANGCDVRFTDADIAEYIAKFGREPKWTRAHELTKAVSKMGKRGGRTPMQLLADHLEGDKAAGRLWLQYAVNFKGERQLFWSHGLRARLQLTEEKTDEEIAIEQEEIAVVLASLSVGAWRVVLANDARAELLFAASTGDTIAVQALLSKLGVSAVSARKAKQ